MTEASSVNRMEIDGRAATAEEADVHALTSYGHFTAMQVRGGRTRGLGLHLARLRQASAEMFDAELDEDLVRARIRHALGGDGGDGLGGEIQDASVRVMVFQPREDAPLKLMVTVRRPYFESGAPQALTAVPYQRPLPHLKQIGGGFGQAYYGRVARRAGFDDALLTAPDGTVAEGSIANIAFITAGALVWPDAPALAGITMQLLKAEMGDGSTVAPVRLGDLGAYDAAVLTNSRGIIPVSRIDGHVFDGDPKAVAMVEQAYESVPWDAF